MLRFVFLDKRLLSLLSCYCFVCFLCVFISTSLKGFFFPPRWELWIIRSLPAFVFNPSGCSFYPSHSLLKCQGNNLKACSESQSCKIIHLQICILTFGLSSSRSDLNIRWWWLRMSLYVRVNKAVVVLQYQLHKSCFFLIILFLILTMVGSIHWEQQSSRAGKTSQRRRQ